MQEEVDALETNATWVVVSLPLGKVPIGCKWVYKVKLNLVTKGYSQHEWINYVDTFSPMAKLVTVRLVLALATVFHWPLFQMDMHNAFLEGDLLEEFYVTLPEGSCSQGENMVYKL
ncbi:hypothetical protein F3Y22_tig00003126pilonHSYRG00101 [Hibiscus syriacus]|uniref:Reverse transcriptase Ty1/copia-type domain-containing protein n=1 Tax=Hibiscus syriacus TaxID=106335 RepID=A0A6A3CRP1_HIBSY|nr:hypothetical protein F3Y22_tig00003126pilonHSYRG00101 [Hibiscus syriacus]